MALTKQQFEEKTAELKEFIAGHKDVQGPLMPTIAETASSLILFTKAPPFLFVLCSNTTNAT